MQLPDEMQYLFVDTNEKPVSFHYLMIFEDRNRIDLTLFPREKFKSNYQSDSLTVVWIDKDGIFEDVLPANDRDYHIRKPNEREFFETCNEFWWICTNVSKGLLRHEITYAKEMLEQYARPMFMKIIEWKIGVEQNFSVSFGKAGKLMYRYLPGEVYKEILQTYSDYKIEDNWKALFFMTELFICFSNEIAEKLSFELNKDEQENTVCFLKYQYDQIN